MELYLSEHCFEDEELKAYCNTSRQIGTCYFTNNKEVPVRKLDELTTFFSGILQLFEEDSNEGSKELIEILENDWSLFSSREVGTMILTEVSKKESPLLHPLSKAQYSEELRKVCGLWPNLKKVLSGDTDFTSTQMN